MRLETEGETKMGCTKNNSGEILKPKYPLDGFEYKKKLRVKVKVVCFTRKGIKSTGGVLKV